MSDELLAANLSIRVRWPLSCRDARAAGGAPRKLSASAVRLSTAVVLAVTRSTTSYGTLVVGSLEFLATRFA